MNFLVKPLLELSEYNGIIDSISKNRSVVITGLANSQKAHVAYSICQHTDKKGVYIAFDEFEARKIYEDFYLFLGEEVLYFPFKEITLHDVEAKSRDNVFKRLEILKRIIEGEYRLIVVSIDSLLHKLIPPRLFTENILEFEVGNRIDLLSIQKKLVAMGYERVAVVENKGQFAVRGGIIDIFSVDYNLAVRIELFDDEIDSIREFDPDSQRSVEQLKGIKIIPAREVIYNEDKREAIVSRIENDMNEVLKKAGKEYKALIRENITNDICKLRDNYYFEGIDRYISYIIDEPSTLVDYTDNCLVFADESGKLKNRIENIVFEWQESCNGLMEKGRLLPGSFNVKFDYEDIVRGLLKSITVSMNTFITVSSNIYNAERFDIASKATGSYLNRMDFLINDLRNWKERKHRILVFTGTRVKGEKLKDTLEAEGVEAVFRESHPDEILPGQVVLTPGSLNNGFEYPKLGFVVVSDKEVFGKERKHRKASGKNKGSKINIFTELNVGDFVVHQSHGIGQYVGIQQLNVDTVRRDYLKIRYHDSDFLYIPTNQLDLIQKYIGSEGKEPKLHKLNGTDWAKTKSRVKESLKEIAEELVKLYAKRQATRGYAFSKDTVWQKQFEDSFPYEETDDQLKCIEEVKQDMEMEKPMDRLLCGDVGYGKTEVAIRAIFKAVMDGKQVAYLVPTTILAQQHYNNFAERMKDFPVTVDVISRFRKQADQKKILKNVKDGTIDVLVGTHRLLQKDLHFKNLGLLVIDEEQRFGVAHKEKIKNITPNIDVLTLTATPIPRTLNMSLVGIRDISVIEDPPEERQPVETFVMEYNPEIIRDAIRREISRSGQIFYLYNRVGSILKKAAELQALVPDARIAVGHGQMDEKELEDIIYDFINGNYDMLVCTTIIESGLDMPNVNTIIIEDADRMGLAQLYQLRGRVGRSNRLAYAYITYKKDKTLSEIAEKRLRAIREFTDLGSGFKIAMRDLELRGAGNLLGAQQSGQMESVGYDMYCRLLDEAVMELKGESPDISNQEITIDINISAYIDNAYIDIENQKIDMYKKIASIASQEDITEIEDELIDRYGNIPKYVSNLLKIAHIKFLARVCGFSSITQKNESVIFQYINDSFMDLSIINKLMDNFRRKIMFNASSKPYLTLLIKGLKGEEILENIKTLLMNIKDLQDGK
ncbi:transcription-repair coupling factor [Pseudobacteroides cellulosolvens]|uniref:Transcription-repair-coupling factor n=1 Tax=Pseudobacteroides cellulosolvens ATCC 35603 = DSM 2933 TaxID=398512 RepID=A0A0L6JNL1_9FIRM|nr:transcription-repair coupling factor [Pseudobacteroides cellulosolvens]KNY27320.1 transcription-repair coupling factor [Pseudobacteroides cellulosolvens ATCC 35603 = DSM 2933]